MTVIIACAIGFTLSTAVMFVWTGLAEGWREAWTVLSVILAGLACLIAIGVVVVLIAAWIAGAPIA